MRDFNKDFVIDLCFIRKRYRGRMALEACTMGVLVFGRVNGPTLMFKVSRIGYYSYLGDIDRDLVASRVLEEL